MPAKVIQNGTGIAYWLPDLTQVPFQVGICLIPSLGTGVVDCTFDNNQMGILSTPYNAGRDTITIKGCKFDNSRASDALNHNIYIGTIKELIAMLPGPISSAEPTK